MWKEELEYHSPGPSPVDVIISVDNSCPNIVKRAGAQFQYKSKKLVVTELRGRIFYYIYFSAVCASVCLSVCDYHRTLVEVK